ncbi:hypothetical protein BDW22DRAFT_1340557 [Trametopsis cervina]|nr:hypothetical protein BDW22DRAFT_1340557 [Trametopsis cervina]
MKFFSLVLPLVVAVAAAAQGIAIGAPAPGSTLTHGQNITVEVDKPNSLTGSTDVAIVIALRSCTIFQSSSCDQFDPSEVLGNILYYGPYSPNYQNVPGQGFKPPYQNFTVNVPNAFQPGPAVLSVSHFVLLGAGPQAILDIVNTTVNVV